MLLPALALLVVAAAAVVVIVFVAHALSALWPATLPLCHFHFHNLWHCHCHCNRQTSASASIAIGCARGRERVKASAFALKKAGAAQTCRHFLSLLFMLPYQRGLFNLFFKQQSNKKNKINCAKTTEQQK